MNLRGEITEMKILQKSCFPASKNKLFPNSWIFHSASMRIPDCEDWRVYIGEIARRNKVNLYLKDKV